LIKTLNQQVLSLHPTSAISKSFIGYDSLQIKFRDTYVSLANNITINNNK
jgi:hypothetical protein